MGKVAIVGVEGSGKTVLMGALCECYKQGSEDIPYLMPENQAAFMFMERIPHRMRVEREWPAATSVDALRTLRWTLRLGAEVLEEIEMLDYPGELYRIAFGEHTKEDVDAHRDELNEFLEHVTGADTLIVLLNVKDTMNLGANPRNAETVWITRGILDFAKKLPGIKRTALMLTQADRYQSVLDVDGGAEGFYAKRLPMMKTLHPDLTVIAVSAVSPTDGEGRPAANYSVEGCREVMREILWEREVATQNGLALCDSICEQIRSFDKGSDIAFIKLLESYYSATNMLKESSKVVREFYSTDIKAHIIRWNDLYYPLHKYVSTCAENSSMERKATKDAWTYITSHVDYCEQLVSAFRNYYEEEVHKVREVKKQEALGTYMFLGLIGSLFLLFGLIAACS